MSNLELHHKCPQCDTFVILSKHKCLSVFMPADRQAIRQIIESQKEVYDLLEQLKKLVTELATEGEQ